MQKISSYEGVAVAIPVTVEYSKTTTHRTGWLIGRVLEELLRESGFKKEKIKGLALSSYSNAPDSGAVMAEHFGLDLDWVCDLPMGGASGVIALKRAARAIQCGDAEVVACIGADRLAGHDFKKLIDNFSSFSRDYVNPYGAAGPNAVFAMITQHYMEMTGATREDFGSICVAQRESARRNPIALLRKSLSMDEYLAAPPIADPLHMFDCVMPCCGGEGYLVMSEELAKSTGQEYAIIKGAMETHNAFSNDSIQKRGGWERASGAMYDQAGLGPDDMDFLQAYDDYPVVVMMQLEGLGFCNPGEASRFVRTTSLAANGGGLPLNTGGGQLSVGQAGAAGGFLGVNEALRQVTERPLGLQIMGATTGIVSGYGYVNYDRGICSSAAILQSSSL